MNEQQQTENISLTPNVKYKDTVFTKLFSDPAILRELYSAIEGVELPPDIPVGITTLSNSLVRGKLNDVSFLMGNRLIVLIEHQSTINENMPFRMLEYIDRSYKGIINSKAMRQRKLVKIPRPEFIVLYNGKDPYNDRRELKLSDAFKDIKGLKADDKTEMSLELVVHVYNINYGHNQEILERSKTLDDYSLFISKIREYENQGFDLAKAVKYAVEYSIKNKVLEEFLRKYGAEVIEMIMEEYTLEDEIEAEREAARMEGREQGLEEGREQGREEGREQGREEGRKKGREEGITSRSIEIAHKMKNAKKSIDEIIEFTGLSPELIDTL